MNIKKLFILFCITFIVTFLAQVIYDYNRPTIERYIKSQIKQAKLKTLIMEYNIKPEGLEG